MSGKYDQYLDCRGFHDEIEKIARPFDLEADPADGLRRLLEDEGTYLKVLTKETYDAMVLIYEIQIQEHILELCGLNVGDLYQLYHSPWSSDWVARSPIRVQLPGVPTRDNETNPFQEKVRESLRLFQAEHGVFRVFHVPVILQAIYKPPSVSWGFYKDLDNIMKLILPIFNETFEPPPTYISRLDVAKVCDERLRGMIEGLPKTVRHSVAGYEIMEIPRRHGDDPQGYITIGITGIYKYRSLWDRVVDIIDKWGEYLEKQC